MEEKKRRPGYLTDYARHAGISKQAAAKQLNRLGIDYRQPFDFDEVDRLWAAHRHVSRLAFTKAEILADDEVQDALDGFDEAQPKASPALVAVQLEKEKVRTALLQLEYRKALGELVEKNKVEEEADRVARTVRDAIMNVAARVGGILAAESDRRKVEEILDREHRQALETLKVSDVPTVPLTVGQLRWYNEGIVLLMNIMRGRADTGEAERSVYEEWRGRGNLIDVGEAS